MVELDDLKAIILLSHLTDAMLEKLVDITLTVEHSAGDYIFRDGDYARYLYASLAIPVPHRTDCRYMRKVSK